MKIQIPQRPDNLTSVMRSVGYRPSRNRYQEQSFVRSAGAGAFPRFHIYPKQQGDIWVLDLHLDQRKPSYEGTRAHGGEHHGPAVEQEAKRIKDILTQA